jgi:hypothetical protein
VGGAGAAALRVLTSQAGGRGRAPTLLDKHMRFVRRRLQLYRRRPTWIQPGVGGEPSLCRSLRQNRRGTRCARPLQCATGPGLDQEVHQGEGNKVGVRKVTNIGFLEGRLSSFVHSKSKLYPNSKSNLDEYRGFCLSLIHKN